MEVQHLLKIRCPDCLKLYSVDRGELHVARPKFQCRDCQTQFWITAVDVAQQDDEVMGFPIEWLTGEPEANSSLLNEQVYSCPKCTEPYSAGQHECTKCGLVFVKFKDKLFENENEPASASLKNLWEQTLAEYDDYKIHQDFIQAAFREHCLDYAAKRYAGLLEACPSDELALRAQKEISALATARVESQVAPRGPEIDWFETFDLFMRKVRFSTLILLMSGIVITMGVLLPSERNLVGIGTSILFFILALRYYFRVI